MTLVDFHDRLALEVEQLLAERGPMGAAELADRLAERGLDLGADRADLIVDEVLDLESEPYWPLADDRWSHLPSLLAGHAFTHRVTSEEIENDLVPIGHDLAPLALLMELPEHARLVDGSAVEVVFPEDEDPDLPESSAELAELDDGSDGELDDWGDGELDDWGVLRLAPGTLTGLDVRNGDLVGFRVLDSGLELTKVEPSAADAAELRSHAVAVLAAQTDEPLELETWIHTLIADEPTAFTRPLPPLGELLVEWEIPTDEGLVGPPGFSFDEWILDSRLRGLCNHRALTEEQAVAVVATGVVHHDLLAVMAAYDAAPDEDDTGRDDAVPPSDTTQRTADEDSSKAVDEQLRIMSEHRDTLLAVLPMLQDPAVADTVLRETGLATDRGAAALGLLAEWMEPLADRRTKPALRWLRSRAYETVGELAEAERHLEAAERLDPRWPLTVVDRARYASDRGDAAAGLALLNRIGDQAPGLLLGLLERHRPAPAQTMPRNAPCWCGSGRKFKQCHLRQSAILPLPERADWLYGKAVVYVTASAWLDVCEALALSQIRYVDDEQQARELVEDGLASDVTLFEAGALEEFLDRRGELLPADELQLARQWLLVERSLFEVTAVSPDRSLTLRDVRTGEVTEVPERLASRQLRPGQYIHTRLLPTGDGRRLFGGIEPVALQDRDELIELLDSSPSPEALVAFSSRRTAPPALANTEGHPTVLCTAELRTGDPEGLAAGLDAAYRRDDAHPVDQSAAFWTELVEVDGLDRIRANLRLKGDTLTISSNSEPRQDAVLRTVMNLQPSISVVRQKRAPLRDIRDAERLTEVLPASARSGSELADLPEMTSFLASTVRDYEQRWLDLPIPALDGRTPREAADDPTRREDLIRLLADFPDADDPTIMSPRRLRAALGLPADDLG